MLSRFLTVAVLATVLAGCGEGANSPGTDGGADASVNLAWQLSIVEQPASTLGLKGVVPLAVRLLDASGAPVAFETVIFGIDGNGYGASLSALEVSTDEDGRAEVRLTTGAMGGPLAVRVSAPYTAPVRIETLVSAYAVGAFAVSATYEGSRTLGVVELAFVPGGDCDDVHTLGAVGDPAGVLEAGSMEGTFGSLPAGSLFAVVAHARALVGGGYAADGCVEDVFVTLGELTSLPITLTDRAVLGAEPLEGAITIEGDAFVGWLAGAGHDAMSAYIAAKGGDGAMLFDVLVSALTEADPPGAVAVASAATPSAIAELDDALAMADAGPSAVASTIRGAFEGIAPDLVLAGTLAFSLTDAPVFTVTGVSFLVEGEQPIVLNDDSGLIGTEITLPGAFAVGYAGYQVSDMTIPFASDDAGAHLYAVLEAVYAEGLAAHYAARLGCTELFASSALDGLPHCTTTTCRDDVCADVYAALRGAAQDAYVDALDRRTRLVLSGSIELLDTNDDDVADTAAATGASVEWSADGELDVLDSTFSLMATAAP